MAITFANVATNDNFSTWLTRTNQMANAFVQVVTVDSNTAVGNAAITGTFTANALTTNTINSTGTILLNSNTDVGATSKFTALGDARFRGTIEIDDITLTSAAGANATHYFLAANSTNSNKFYFATMPSTFSTNATFSANVSIAGRLSVAGNVAFNNSLTVVNNTTVSNTLTVSGTSSFAANASFASNVSFGANVSISQRLSVANSVSFSNTLAVTGTVTLTSISANGGLGAPGQVLTSNGTSTYWSTTGGVTSVGSGNGLTGGPITGSGSLSVVAANGIAVSAGGVRINAQTGLVANTTGLFVDASSIAVGTLAVARGGTGTTTLPSGSILKGNGAAAISNASSADIVAAIGTRNVANASFALLANNSTNATLAATANVAKEVDNQNSASNLKLWTGTLSQYTNILTKDPNTLYFVSA